MSGIYHIHHYELVERSSYVPRGEAPPPVPDWKRRDWARDVLPAGDPAAERARVSRAATRPSRGAS